MKRQHIDARKEAEGRSTSKRKGKKKKKRKDKKRLKKERKKVLKTTARPTPPDRYIFFPQFLNQTRLVPHASPI